MSRSPEQTESFAARFSKRLKPGEVVGLCGELGSGKTTFMKGILTGLGGGKGAVVTSPTFVLLHEYPTRRGPLCHLDLYRLEKPSDLREIDLDGLVSKKGFVFIEWADKFDLLKNYCKYWIGFELRGEKERKISVTP